MRSSRPEQAAPKLVDIRLDNGARVIVQQLDARGSGAGASAVQLWIGAGTSAERADEHGCAHLLEHMLFKKTVASGTGRRGKSIDLATALENLGGDVNAFTSHDETVVHATVPATEAAVAIAVIGRAALTPALDPEALAQEREVVVEEIKQYDDEPGQRVFHQIMRRVHGGAHSYARPVLGLAHEVRGHTASRLRAYHRRAYAGSRVTLVVVGAVDVAAVLRASRRALGGLPRATRLVDEAPPKRATRPRVHVRRGDVQEVSLMLGWSTAAAGAPDACAFDVAGVVLGHGEASRLVRETRRGAQVVSEVQCASETQRRAGSLLISAHTTGPQVVEATAALLAQIERMRVEPIAAEELARARAILESDQVYRQETVQGRAHAIGHFVTVFGDIEYEKVYYAALAQLTPERVREACAALAASRVTAAFELPQSGTTAATVNKLGKLFELPAKPKLVKRSAKLVPDRHGILSVDLPSGLRVRARIDHTVPMAGGWLVWPGGQGAEPSELPGAAAATAGLLTRGNARFDGDEISRTVDGLAAGLDGFAGRNSLGLHWESLARDVPHLLDLALECGRSPKFLASELAEERRVALQELAAEADDLGQLAIRAMLGALHGEHPLSRPMRGTATGLRALTGARLSQLWRREHPLSRAVLGLVGDFDLEAVLAQLADMNLGTGRKGQVAKARRKSRRSTPTGQRVREIFKQREQAHIALGFPGLALGDPREPIMDLLTTVLGGQSGRLFTALRERQGLVYEVSVSATAARDAGHIVVHASTGQDKLPRAQAAIAAELARAVAEPPAADELARARAWLIGQHEIGQQRRSRVASQIAFSAAYGLPHARHFEYPARVAAITGAQVWGLARTLLDPSRQVVAVVRAR